MLRGEKPSTAVVVRGRKRRHGEYAAAGGADTDGAQTQLVVVPDADGEGADKGSAKKKKKAKKKRPSKLKKHAQEMEDMYAKLTVPLAPHTHAAPRRHARARLPAPSVLPPRPATSFVSALAVCGGAHRHQRTARPCTPAHAALPRLPCALSAAFLRGPTSAGGNGAAGGGARQATACQSSRRQRDGRRLRRHGGVQGA